MTTDGGSVPAVGLTLLVGVLIVVGLTAVSGKAATQSSAPDCSNVSSAQTASGYYEVTTVSQLQCMGNASTSTASSDSIVQTENIDASNTSS